MFAYNIWAGVLRPHLRNAWHRSDCRAPLIAVVVMWISVTGGGSAGETRRTVILSDGPLPGVPEGVRIEGFQAPHVSEDGRVAFQVGLLQGAGGTDDTNRTAIWAETEPGTVRLVARQGDQIPSLTYRFDDLSPGSNLQMTASGNVYFVSGMSHITVPSLRNSAIYQFTPSTGVQAYVATGPVGNDDVHVLGIGPDASATHFSVNDTGDVAMRMLSFTTPIDAVMALQANGSVSVVASEGAFPSINLAGSISYRVGDRIAGRELRVWNPNNQASRLVAREGGVAPGVSGGTFRLIADTPSASVNGENGLMFVGELRRGGSITVANDYGIWGESSPGGPVELLLREGDRAPDTEEGVVWAGFSNFAVPAIFGRQGGMALKLELAGPGIIDSNNLAVWAGPSAQDLHLVAREGMLAPGTEEGTFFQTFTSFGVTQDGRGVFVGHLAGQNLPSGSDRGIWAETPNGTLQLLVRAGDTLTLPNGQQTTFVSVDFDSAYGVSEQGHVAFLGNLASFQWGVFVTSDFATLNIRGDFSGDGLLNSDDIDLLIHGIALNDLRPSFDLNNDSLLNLDDRDAWLSLAGERNRPLGQPYPVADANLDGSVDAIDLQHWLDHRFSIDPAWSTGDFNADGTVDGSDFGLWLNHRSIAANHAELIPEPHALTFCSLYLFFLTSIVRRRAT